VLLVTGLVVGYTILSEYGLDRDFKSIFSDIGYALIGGDLNVDIKCNKKFMASEKQNEP
jgi:hypothetical protein